MYAVYLNYDLYSTSILLFNLACVCDVGYICWEIWLHSVFEYERMFVSAGSFWTNHDFPFVCLIFQHVNCIVVLSILWVDILPLECEVHRRDRRPAGRHWRENYGLCSFAEKHEGESLGAQGLNWGRHGDSCCNRERDSARWAMSDGLIEVL